jgi:hypothetical protein
MPNNIRICYVAQTDITKPTCCIGCGAVVSHQDPRPVAHLLKQDTILCYACVLRAAEEMSWYLAPAPSVTKKP